MNTFSSYIPGLCPNFHLPFTPSVQTSQFIFFPTFPIPSFCSAIIHGVWKILHYLSTWKFQLITKVMQCFISIHKSPSPEFKLDELFNKPIDYEQFREQTLNYKKNNELFFNNYGTETYLQYKKCNFDLLDTYQDPEEKELKAGIAVYEALVNLYVGRFLEKHPELNQENYLPSLRTVALGIAFKLSWDEAILNTYLLAFISPKISPTDYQRMEIEFLKGMDWNLAPTDLFLEPSDIDSLLDSDEDLTFSN